MKKIKVSKRLPDNMGEVVSANNKMIKLSIGMTLRPGQRVYLPPIAGGKLGKVDQISMIFDEKELKAQVVLRIIDSSGKGHQFRWDAA
jgi:hypothetical protein